MLNSPLSTLSPNINNEDYIQFAEEMGYNIAEEDLLENGAFGNLSPVYASTNSNSNRHGNNPYVRPSNRRNDPNFSNRRTPGERGHPDSRAFRPPKRVPWNNTTATKTNTNRGRVIRGTAGGRFNEFGNSAGIRSNSAGTRLTGGIGRYVPGGNNTRLEDDPIHESEPWNPIPTWPGNQHSRSDINQQLQQNRRQLTMTPELKQAMRLNKPGGALNAMNDLHSRNPYQNSGINLSTGGGRSLSSTLGASKSSDLIRADNIILNTIHKVRRVWGREEKSEKLKQDRFDAIVKSGDKGVPGKGKHPQARLPLRVSLSANQGRSDCVKMYQRNQKVWQKYPALALKDDPHQVRKRREKEERALIELMGNGDTVLRKIMPSVNASFLNRATFASNQRRALNNR